LLKGIFAATKGIPEIVSAQGWQPVMPVAMAGDFMSCFVKAADLCRIVVWTSSRKSRGSHNSKADRHLVARMNL
jgi:hypothetical protein